MRFQITQILHPAMDLLSNNSIDKMIRNKIDDLVLDYEGYDDKISSKTPTRMTTDW